MTSMSHLDAAQAYLEGRLNDREVVNRKSYRILFPIPPHIFPAEAVGSRLVYQTPGSWTGGFSHCNECHMAVPSASLQEHLQNMGRYF